MRTRDEQKELLVKEKAVELLVKHGFDGFSMQKLAKEAGISPATLYIYYTDRDDLIEKLGTELGERFYNTMMDGFSPKMSLRDGLKKQWENRARYMLAHPLEAGAFEVIRHSPVGIRVMQSTTKLISPIMAEFTHNAIEKKELQPMELEAYWSITYGPLYTLLKFHLDGRSMGMRPFVFSDKVMYDTLELVLKALKP